MYDCCWCSTLCGRCRWFRFGYGGDDSRRTHRRRIAWHRWTWWIGTWWTNWIDLLSILKSNTNSKFTRLFNHILSTKLFLIQTIGTLATILGTTTFTFFTPTLLSIHQLIVVVVVGIGMIFRWFKQSIIRTIDTKHCWCKWIHSIIIWSSIDVCTFMITKLSFTRIRTGGQYTWSITVITITVTIMIRWNDIITFSHLGYCRTILVHNIRQCGLSLVHHHRIWCCCGWIGKEGIFKIG